MIRFIFNLIGLCEFGVEAFSNCFNMRSSINAARTLLTQRTGLFVTERLYCRTLVARKCVDSRLAQLDNEWSDEQSSRNKRDGKDYFKYSTGAALLVAGVFLFIVTNCHGRTFNFSTL